jgi:hypothetical protein
MSGGVTDGESLSGLPAIGATLVSARSYEEYVAMFGLDETDLSATILDCPGGAASFCAEAQARGIAVTAVDPVYAADATWLREHAVDEAIRGNRHTAASLESFSWTFFTDIDDHLQRRTSAARSFGKHFGGRRTPYVAAALPSLPFRDRAFDLVLSSHFLFMYADRLDDHFHYLAAAEMLRVARREVRIFPLVADPGTDTGPLLRSLRKRLSEASATCEMRPSRYEFQRGGDEILVISRDH